MENRYSLWGGTNLVDKVSQLHKLQTLKVIAETLNQSNDLHLMLQQVLKELLEVTRLETGWLFLIDVKGKYELIADYNLPPALTWEQKKPMCQGICWCVDKYNKGRLLRAANIMECKRLEDAVTYNWGETNQITHHATVPLRAGEERFGLLNVASPNKTHFTNEELALLESVAFQIGTAIKRIKLAENEQNLALLAERNRLARDLHDSVNQLLFSLVLTVRGTKELTEDPELKEMLSYMQELSQEALSEMKALIWQLRPQGLENGVASALLNYGKVLGIQVDVEVKGVIDLPSKIEEALWRIGQEALNNCKKHSGVTASTIMISVTTKAVAMKITDSGCGFHYVEDQPIPSLGLASMRERTEALNGTFTLTSEIGKGTAIYIEIPLREV
ncbi:GAF domain-containing sensor histidine kinase [Fredinandcohnia sp. 179-A 10B2 NHS]|uniref:GAF domain-containing sensor histidine kinase n=1 Tax=Fredinandcohnia sp. 179-A 10B2 NHS TaxID=3235176 RepID=UPI00399F0AD7